MTGYLKDLLGQLDAVKLNGINGPEDAVQEGDHIVGVMSDGLKRLWVLRSQVAKDGLQACLHGLTTLAEAKGVELMAAKQDGLQAVGQQLKSLRRRGQILDELLWESIDFEFPELAAKPSVGVRMGWQVVWSEERPEPADMLESILRAAQAGHVHVIQVGIPRQKPQG